MEGLWWEIDLIDLWDCWLLYGWEEHLCGCYTISRLSHYTWLRGFGITRYIDFIRWRWVVCDDRVSWLLNGINYYHRAFGVGAFPRYQRGWHGYVWWMPVFSINHVRSWKHDVRGCGQRMGGHHFMSLFTLSPLHIEIPIASPSSLTRAP